MSHTIWFTETLSTPAVIILGNTDFLKNTPTTVSDIVSYRHIKNNILSMANINLTEKWVNKQCGEFITPVTAISPPNRLTLRASNTWRLAKVGQKDD